MGITSRICEWNKWNMIVWVTVVLKRTVIDNDCQTIKVICVPSVVGVLTLISQLQTRVADGRLSVEP